MDTIYELVHFAKNLKYEDIPAEDIEGAKLLIMDILAVSTAGTTAEGVKEVKTLLDEWGGKEESRVLIFDEKLPAYHAGFLNSVLSHARDFDEVQPDAVCHTGISVIPTVLTMADELGNIDGKKLITTIVAAVDVFVRMGFGVAVSGTESGWIYSALIGHLIAPLAAGLLMDLTEEQLVDAIGISYSQAGGNQQAARDTSLTKRMQPAYAVRSGIVSAKFAKAGITGAHNIIDGAYSFYHIYIHDRDNKEKITEDLGKKFWIHTLSYKPYPVCGQCLSPTTDVEYLMRENNIRFEEITGIEVGTNQHGYRACVEPEEVKYNPQRTVDGQFSIPYSVTCMAMRGHVGLADLTPEAVTDPAIHAWIKNVKAAVDPDVQAEYPRGICPAKTTIHTTRGDFTAQMFQKGHPTNPFDFEDMKNKFRECVKLCIYPMNNVEEMLTRVEHMENEENVAQFITDFNACFDRA